MEEMTQNTVEFESLLAYDSSEDFSDTENTFEDICSEMEDTRENEEDNSLELYKYAAAKGHGVRIGGGGKVDKMINEVMKRRYLCHHAGKASSKQTTRSNVTSCRVECPWKVNIWVKEKKGYLEVTTFNDHHVGYECHPSAMNATVQYRIIREKFKIRIHRPDLYNAIGSFRREATPGEEDTGLLLKRLYDKKTEDPRWVEYFTTKLSAIKRLFNKGLRMQSSIKSWARSFTNKYFTAGMQTTSRNEGENSTLKRLFGNSNLSLCELFDALEERYQEENDYCEFEEQMNLSLCYHATEIEFENARSKENIIDESNRCIDNLFDFPQVHLSSFLEDTLTILEVWEIVYLANSKTSHFVYLLNDNTFLCTYPLQKNDISNNEFVVISLNTSASKKHSLPTQFLQQSSRQIGEIGTSNDNSKISRVISKKRKFGELYGLGRKLVVDVIEEGDENTYNEVLEFFRSIRWKISQRNLESGSDGNFNIQNENNIIEIQNSVVRRPKGHPKSKRTTSVLEESNTKTQYKCKLCKQIGHNSKTCKGKENQEV
ncbi:unnamed protein product [Rhizophagus irregularis]|nr:unnamed protein product [Rhizophagus irregularis]